MTSIPDSDLEPLAEVEGALLVVEVLHLPHPQLGGLGLGDSLEHFSAGRQQTLILEGILPRMHGVGGPSICRKNQIVLKKQSVKLFEQVCMKQKALGQNAQRHGTKRHEPLLPMLRNGLLLHQKTI